MPALRRILPTLLCAMAALALPQKAEAQVVVFQLEFKHLEGFNVDFFSGGYFVAPATGGEGTFVLTAVDNGRFVLEPDGGSGTLFIGRNRSGKRYTVVSATAGVGGQGSSPGGSYLAFGEAKGYVSFTTPVSTTRVRMAKTLRGESIAAASEDGEVADDGSFGYANRSEMVMRFDGRLSEIYNEEGLSVEEAVTEINTLLERKGFDPPTTDDGGDDN